MSDLIIWLGSLSWGNIIGFTLAVLMAEIVIDNWIKGSRYRRKQREIQRVIRAARAERAERRELVVRQK